MSLLLSVCQPSTLRMLICPDASNAQNSMAAVSAEGSTVCVLIRSLNSSCNRSIAFLVRALFHWLGGRRAKAKRLSPALLQAVGDGAMLEPPLADESLATRRDLLGRCRIDHVVVFRGDLLVQALRRVPAVDLPIDVPTRIEMPQGVEPSVLGGQRRLTLIVELLGCPCYSTQQRSHQPRSASGLSRPE